MDIQTAYSTQSSVQNAVAEIKHGLKMPSLKMVIFFASSCYPPDEIAREMHAAFPNITVFGCTTAGEIISGKMLKNSIVAMAFSTAIIDDVAVEILTNVNVNTSSAVTHAFAIFEKHYGTTMLDADPEKYVGVVLIDGLSEAEENLMWKISDLTNVNFIGASAGDDLELNSTYVFARGQAHANASILALLKPAVAFDFIKTQSFTTLDKTLIPTKVRREKREVLEFNNRPAAVTYAEALGIAVEKLPNYFMTNPVALVEAGEIYVRSPQRLQGNTIRFYCAINKNIELQLLSSADIVKGTRKALKDKLKKVNHIEGLINFHCILRTLELEKKDALEAYGHLFADIPTIGFSAYGEEFNRHMNHTSTMLVFLSDRQ